MNNQKFVDIVYKLYDSKILILDMLKTVVQRGYNFIKLSLIQSSRAFASSLKTPLYDLHVNQGGQIVDFAGTFF